MNKEAKNLFIQALKRVEVLTKKGYELTETDMEWWWKDFQENSKEPIAEDLAEAAREKARFYGYESGDYEFKEIVESFKEGAKLQREKIMANSTDATIGVPYEDYGGYTQLVSVQRPLPVGKKKIAIIFEEG